jgi:hypothetical protein
MRHASLKECHHMNYPFIKAGAAVLFGALLASPAYAVSPPSLNEGASLLIQVQDEENQELMRDMQTEETEPEAPAAKEGEAPKAAPTERKEEGQDGDDIEEKEMKEDGLNVPE